MVGFWVSFGLFFPFVLFSAAGLKIYAKKHSKIVITPEMDKVSNQKLGRVVFFLWLLNFFYMSCFINNLVCKFIFGGLIMLIVFMNLTSVFVNSKERSNFDKWSLLFDFLVGIGFSIYLVYIIPNQGLKDVILPIVAALYGGLLTLAGVAWTIKNSESNIRLDNKMKNKPVLIMINNYRLEDTNLLMSINEPKLAFIKELPSLPADLGFIMKNISQMPCKIVGINYLDKEILCSDKHMWIESNQSVWIGVQINNFKYNGQIDLILEDISGNRYIYLLKYNEIGYITSVKEKENK